MTQTAGTPNTVLLVGDHPLGLGGLEQLLGTEPDFNVVAPAATVEDAWQAVQAHRPDVVVLDVNLPGEDALGLLRRLDSARGPAVVILTASQDEDLLLDAARLGARGI